MSDVTSLEGPTRETYMGLHSGGGAGEAFGISAGSVDVGGGGSCGGEDAGGAGGADGAGPG